MSRIKIELPQHFKFTATPAVRITDINYGNHVGNDSILSLLHEARMQFLHHHGYSEMNFAGVGMIMRDVIIEFKKEIFYGDQLIIGVTAGAFTSVSFDLYYKVEKKAEEKSNTVVTARTGMVCYDYSRNKIVAVPEAARLALTK
jgi:YbgC/YbaW family acyl-CoA thioester hydrolase